MNVLALGACVRASLSAVLICSSPLVFASEVDSENKRDAPVSPLRCLVEAKLAAARTSAFGERIWADWELLKVLLFRA